MLKQNVKLEGHHLAKRDDLSMVINQASLVMLLPLSSYYGH